MNYIKTQTRLLIILSINIAYSLIPTFSLKNLFLRAIKIKIGPKSYIHRKVRFFKWGNLRIGSNSTINFGCFIDNRAIISIGSNVGIAHCCKIYTMGHDINNPYFSVKTSPVSIEDNVFIFSNCLIMPGITIGEGAIVLAGSVVTKNIPRYTVYGGNPAKLIKKRSQDIKYSRDYGFWFAN